MGSLTIFPFTHSVARELEAMAEPHPNVLNLASTILPFSSTLIWRNQLFVKIYNAITNIFPMKWSQGFSFMVSLEANYTIVRAHKNVNYETQFHCLQPEKKNISHHAESHQPHLQHVFTAFFGSTIHFTTLFSFIMLHPWLELRYLLYISYLSSEQGKYHCVP